MKKFKEFGQDLAARLVGWSIMIYVIGVIIAGIHFQKQDMGNSDSFLWRLVVSPKVGFFKGIIWPYYFLKSSPESKVDNPIASIEAGEIQFSKNKSVNAYLNALAAYSRAFEYVEEKRSTGDRSKDREIIQSLLSRTETLLNDCDVAELDAIYQGMGQSVVTLKPVLKSFHDHSLSEEEANNASNVFASWINANKPSLLIKLAKEDYLLAPTEHAAAE